MKNPKQNPALSIFKSILFVSMLLFIAYIFSSCSSDDPKRWNNTYVIFNPDQLNEILVLHPDRENTLYDDFHDLNFDSFLKMRNGENYLVEFQETAGSYRLSVTTEAEVDYITFSGFVGLIDTDQEFEKTGTTYTLEAKEIAPKENNYYYIELSNDLSK